MGDSVKKIYHIMNASDHNERAGIREYHVKSYQRGYRWGIYQIQCLLNDIYLNYKRYYAQLKNKTTEMSGYEYCLQPLVIKEDESDNGQNVKRYSVIDGQQRLTTLSLIFKALNHLQGKDAPGNTGKLDEIRISYDRDSTKEILNNICESCKKIDDFDLKDLTHAELFRIFENEKISTSRQIEELNNIIEDSGSGLNIDGKFMVNAYIYLYLYFKIIIDSDNSKDSYFGFTNEETDEMKDYRNERIVRLNSLFKYFTTIIWYEPLSGKNTQATEEDIFENFNSRKIPLTKSELTKALFMNPENYIKEGMEYNSEAIKTRQILIGNRWDDMEKRLHDDELWHFFPHYDNWHSQTRFDAVIDYFVYCTYEEREGQIDNKIIKNNFEADALFSFKMLDKWIGEDLSKAENSGEKAEIMKKWWGDICEKYDAFAMFMEPDKRMIELFHRVSLIQWMSGSYFKKVSRGSRIEAYLNSLSVNKELFIMLQRSGNSDKKKVLNGEIIGWINKFYDKPEISITFHTPDNYITVNRNNCKNDIEKTIKSLAFESGNLLIEVFVIIFSLRILERNSGLVSRFSFYSYFLKKETKNKEDWILEHIFARGSSMKDKDRKFIENIINSGWKEYVEYKFDGVLEAGDIQKIVDRKEYLVSIMKQLLESDEEIPDIVFETKEGYAADYVNPIFDNDKEGILAEFLKDNSMGNMAILSRSDNSAVSNSDYEDKKKIILDRINAGMFVPVATVNMFTGTYCKEGFSTDIWYPCHRQKYLQEMIIAAKEYIEG